MVAAVLILGVETVLFLASVAKLASGGWVPILIAGGVILVMLTWRQGSANVQQRRANIEGTLQDFITHVRQSAVPRVPSLAVFPHHDKVTTPLALRQTLDSYRVLPESIVIVTIINENVPHVRHVDRAVVDDLGSVDDGIMHIGYHVGFSDSQHVPAALQWAQGKGQEESDPNGWWESRHLPSRRDPPDPEAHGGHKDAEMTKGTSPNFGEVPLTTTFTVGLTGFERVLLVST